MTRFAKNPSYRGLALMALAAFTSAACDSPTDTPPATATPVAYVEITTQFGQLTVGESITLQTRLLSAEGAPLNRAVAWASSDTAVARITAAGALTARAAGTADITAISEGVQASVTVDVRDADEQPAVLIIEVAGPGRPLTVGETFQLAAVVRDGGGVILDQPVAWSTSDSAVAVVAPGGFLTAVGLGTFQITAAVGEQKAIIDVIVRSVPALATQLVPASVQAGSAGIELTIRGTGFEPGASVRYAGQLRPARVISTTEVRIDVSADDLKYAGGAEVKVLNPGQTVGSSLFFIIERVPTTDTYALVGLAWDENPLLPVPVQSWWELEDAPVFRHYERRVTAGVLRIHTPATGREQWELTITTDVLRKDNGAVSDEENIVFHGMVEYQSPSPEMVLRSAMFPDLVLHTTRIFNGDLVVWQTLHPSGDPQHEKAWRYSRQQ
jgi:hypothetical protein